FGPAGTGATGTGPRFAGCPDPASRGALVQSAGAARSRRRPPRARARAAEPRARRDRSALEPLETRAALGPPGADHGAARVRAALLSRARPFDRTRRAGVEARGAGLGIARSRAPRRVGEAAAAPLLHHRPRAHPPPPGAPPGAAGRAGLRPVDPGALAAPGRPSPRLPRAPARLPRPGTRRELAVAG